ncbi:hypothetical protein SESBI_35861 [Sesbania bispinosa]|nr:hypothetical protein SESBI_35861 [Sesbania bispinosa]
MATAEQGSGEALSTSNPEAVPVSTSAWQSSGSIGPFFVVMFVITILAVLSCYLGRRWSPSPRATTPFPLESITRDYFGWMFRKCTFKDVEVGANVMVCGQEKNDCKVKDAEISQHNPTQV